MNLKKTLCLMGVLFLCILCFTACGHNQTAPSAASPSPNWAPGLAPLSQPVTVKVGMKAVISDAGILIGMAKGYYQDLGIQIDPIQFSSGQEMINQLAAGQLDVGATVTASGLFNAMSRDIPVKIVADKGINVPNQGYYRMVIRKDLTNVIKDYGDLKGRKVAIVGAASLDEISADRVLNKAGLTTRDVDLQIIRSFSDMLVSLSNHSIDAAMVIEPFIAQGIAKDLLDPWKDPMDYDPNAQTAILVFGSSLTQREEVADRFMTAYLKSLRDYNDAFFHNRNKQEIIDILCKYSVIKEPALYDKMFPTGLNPEGYIRMQGIAMDLEWYQNHQLIKPLTVQDVVDNHYVDFAQKILGPYQPAREGS